MDRFNQFQHLLSGPVDQALCETECFDCLRGAWMPGVVLKLPAFPPSSHFPMSIEAQTSMYPGEAAPLHSLVAGSMCGGRDIFFVFEIGVNLKYI